MTMKLIDVYRQRRSVRAFAPGAIDADVWDEILEAGRVAATSRGKQARRFVTITDPATIAETVDQAKMQVFLKDCSALVVGCQTGEAASAADVIISMAQMEAVAVSHGLGTLWLGVFDREVIRRRINLPDDYKEILMMAFGYPAETGKQPPKLPKEELFREDRF
ncbi:MAG TPA: nitroreductase family protein [Bacillota bacterium]|nr:nitroreductase family protein [Bacillota bacterium]